MKLAEVEMYTDINNKAQQRCLQKLGFQLVQSLGYDDHQVHRLGHLYRLGNEQYQLHPVYQYVYE
jgi:RimJ/RimL family protein N-acetyltransferase